MNRLVWQWRWAKRNPLFWCNMALVIAVGALLIVVSSDLQVRFVGAALELIGVATVWHDLSRAVRKTGAKGVWVRTLDWLRAGVRGATQHVSVGTLGRTHSFLGGHATLRHMVGPDAPVEERIAGIEKNVEQLYKQLQETRESLDKAVNDATKAIAFERETREQQLSAVQGDLVDFATGSYSTLLFGVVWLCVGLLLSAFSQEIVAYWG